MLATVIRIEQINGRIRHLSFFLLSLSTHTHTHIYIYIYREREREALHCSTTIVMLSFSYIHELLDTRGEKGLMCTPPPFSQTLGVPLCRSYRNSFLAHQIFGDRPNSRHQRSPYRGIRRQRSSDFGRSAGGTGLSCPEQLDHHILDLSSRQPLLD